MNRKEIPRERRWQSIEGYLLWLTYYQNGISNLDNVYDDRMDQATFDPVVKVRQCSDGWVVERIMTDSDSRLKIFNPKQVGVFGRAYPEPDLIDDDNHTYEVKGTPSTLHLKKSTSEYYIAWKYSNRFAKKILVTDVWKNGKSLFKTEMWNGHLAAILTEDDLMVIGTCIEINSPLVYFGDFGA